MSDWLIILGGGIVLFWAGAWLLLHLGNFEVRISQLRQTLEARVSMAERQMDGVVKSLNEAQRINHGFDGQLAELRKDLTETRKDLEDVKKSINVLDVALADLKLKVNMRNSRFG
ncbi:hypothetical protein [Ferrovibrio sp.]|uniref:hypothetical protein n=1 Tax=Ferrovibrio sp. TaxID=1917215 RepID=UPI0025C02309|nr:hypothetical protein [Ferrovibrio sp.]MBX3455188.1 hypothetical protein [Ferrovibrio sp.]